jgi:hypothetical protein
MKPRFMKLPIVACASLIAGLLIGAALIPVAAQPQQAPPDGQVAVRSDGAVYLIANGQRRWIAPVVITDDEINAYPEGEPIYYGVAPLPAPPTSTVPPSSAPPAPPPRPAAPTPSTTAPQVNSVPGAPVGNPSGPSAPAGGQQPGLAPGASQPGAVPSNPAPSNPGAAAPIPNGAPAGQPSTTPGDQSTLPDAVGNATGPLSLVLELERPTLQHGDPLRATYTTTPGASCELTVQWSDGSELSQPARTADSSGHCSFDAPIPATVPLGLGTLRGTVHDSGGRTGQQTVYLRIVAGP